MGKFQPHMHSIYSKDSDIKLIDAIKILKKNNFTGFSLTDHDTQKGIAKAKILAKEYDLQFIEGIEISTNLGHIIGLNVLDDRFFKGIDANEAIDIIHENGGIAICAHPFDILRHGVGENIEKLKLDAIETKNTKALNKYNLKAINYAENKKMAVVGGSDAHCLFEINTSFTLYDKNINFLNCIKSKKTIAKGGFSYVSILSSFKRRFKRYLKI